MPWRRGCSRGGTCLPLYKRIHHKGTKDTKKDKEDKTGVRGRDAREPSVLLVFLCVLGAFVVNALGLLEDSDVAVVDRVVVVLQLEWAGSRAVGLASAGRA